MVGEPRESDSVHKCWGDVGSLGGVGKHSKSEEVMMGLEGVFLTLTEELEESVRFWKGKSRKSEEGS
ncbi:hypothetical protein ACFX13_017842 [Malus domestica]